MFAEDSKLFSTDITSLQHDIDSLTNWCTATDLSVNHDKCSLIVFKGNLPRHVMVNDQDITASNIVKDLGLLVSDDLNWMIHINKKQLLCNKSLHFIRRNFSFTVSQSTKLMFVNMCKKSINFYASPVWFPSLCYIRKLESFNRKCLKWVIGSIPYRVISHENFAYLLSSYFQRCVTVLQKVTWSYKIAVFCVFLFLR